MPIPVKASTHAPGGDAATNIKHFTAAKSVIEPASVAPLFSGSNITVFLRNLRLLNLHRHADWPSICADTFSTKGAHQNQKKRIRCVEWALYHLFEVWDIEETQDVRTVLRPANL